jgi:ferrochelatase
VSSQKTAVILFNLGGPDSPQAIRPFLFNLFNDKSIIGVPQPIRWLLARHISGKRAPVAAEIYRHLGGRSPLLEQTEAQARALEAELGGDYRCFIAMRYWHPMSGAAAQAAKEWGAERVVLLPLYPQFSTTTTGSSLRDWHESAARADLHVPTEMVCCYPMESGLIHAMVQLVQAGLDSVEGPVRVLFSAHGLPQSIIDKGDPYQAQIEQTAAAIVQGLGDPSLDWAVCYQSRVGKRKWIGPSTESELERAGKIKRSVVVVPLAFVSEHSETLVELDIEYRHLAESLGIPTYVRVATVGCHPAFIAGLAGLVRKPDRLSGKACALAGKECPGC